MELTHSLISKYSAKIKFIGYLKGKSSLLIFDRHANLIYRYGNREFWCRGYYVETEGVIKKQIETHIRNQVQEDYVSNQLTLFEEYDPFTGQKTTKK